MTATRGLWFRAPTHGANSRACLSCMWSSVACGFFMCPVPLTLLSSVRPSSAAAQLTQDWLTVQPDTSGISSIQCSFFLLFASAVFFHKQTIVGWKCPQGKTLQRQLQLFIRHIQDIWHAQFSGLQRHTGAECVHVGPQLLSAVCNGEMPLLGEVWACSASRVD